MVFDRVASFSVKMDQTGVVQTFSLLICLFIDIIGGTQNSIEELIHGKLFEEL